MAPRAVSAHLGYISRQGKLELETDEGERITSRDEHKTLLKSWHLELSAGQYRRQNERRPNARTFKLVHNIVLSMPAPTPPEKVLAAARKFAKEKFALQHRYVMALHTDQQHPHVHVVVKAESELGRRLHIDKLLLREWREDFARMMREQGIEANATSRVVRGRTKASIKDSMYRAQQHGKSRAVRERVMAIAQELSQTEAVRDPALEKLITTRKEVVANWMKAAKMLDAQGEIALAGDVRYFANHLPPVLTDREQLATDFIRYVKAQRSGHTRTRHGTRSHKRKNAMTHRTMSGGPRMPANEAPLLLQITLALCRPRLKAKPERLHHFEHSAETRITVLRESLVQALPRDPGCLGQPHHAPRPRDIAERCSNESCVLWSFLEASLKVRRHIFLGLEVVRGVVAGKPLFGRSSSFRSHTSTFPLGGNCQGALDVRFLCPFVTAAQQYRQDRTALQVVHAIARPVVHPNLADASTDWPYVTLGCRATVGGYGLRSVPWPCHP